MTAEIISIGDEILIGQVVNTNASHIGEKLSALGIRVRRVSVTGDSHAEILESFRSAWEHNDVVIATGGLGPTHDDVTRAVVTDFFSTRLVYSPEVLGDIDAMFTRLGRTLLDVHRDQAMVPEDCEVMRNANGTAPGYHFVRGGKHFFATPGVPFEMKAMLSTYILPALASGVDETRMSETLLTTGIPESNLAALLDGIEPLLHGTSLAYLPSALGVRLRLTAVDADAAMAAKRLAALRAFIVERADEFIYGSNDDTLESFVGEKLANSGLVLSTAESCTGGQLADRITNVPGASVFFDRGIVAYSNACKTELLGVSGDLIAAHGAVSGEVACAMAFGVRARSRAGISIATTGIAGPTGGSESKPVGLVWIALSDADGTQALRFLFGKDRLRTKQRAVQAALDMLRRRVTGLPLNSPIAQNETFTWEQS